VSGPQLPRLKGGTTATPLSADEIAARVSRSSDFLKNGDFAAARLLLRRAAESGSANAALMLGKTFDPLYLNELGAVGIQPDIEQCRLWYEKAAELGSAAAAQRLANLAKVGQ
jgi:TPR repeat protein